MTRSLPLPTTTLIRAWLLSALVGAYAAAVVLVERLDIVKNTAPPLGLEALLGCVAGVLILFRTNRAYDRWWEARTLWGRLTNASRNLAVKVRELVRPEPAEAAECGALIASFARVLKDHLHRPGPSPEHAPSSAVAPLYARFHDWKGRGLINTAGMWALDQEARVFLEVCGGCERIRNTPVPPSWRRLVREVLFLFLISLPWGLFEQIGWWSIPLVVLASYLGISTEVIASHVEEPFGDHEDHLDLEAMCSAIDRSVSGLLGKQAP